MNRNYLRIIVDCIGICAVFILPWWVTVLLCLVSAWFFNYIEILIFGFIIDLLYGGQYGIISHILFGSLGYLIYISGLYGKKKLSFYKET